MENWTTPELCLRKRRNDGILFLAKGETCMHERPRTRQKSLNQVSGRLV